MVSYFESRLGSVTWGTGARLNRVIFVLIVYQDNIYFYLLKGSGVAYAYKVFKMLCAACYLLCFTRL
jgi:hypothetical protein